MTNPNPPDNQDAKPERQVILTLPAYNEAENLRPLVEHAVRLFSEAGLNGRIIIVNDGSIDATAQVLETLHQEYGVQVLTHPQNRGLGPAIMTGLRAAVECSKFPDDIIICMDADNTHSPEYIPGMVRKVWDEGYDIVIASRYQPGSQEIGVPPFRLLLSRSARLVFKAILRLPGVRDYTCGYRAYRVGLITDALERYGDGLIRREGFACTDELLVRLSHMTNRITEVPFVLRYDQKRSRSKLPLFKTIWETLKLLRETRD
jgi:dolichol-phosphate mannosyltransferase